MVQVCYDCLENRYVEVWDQGSAINMRYDEAALVFDFRGKSAFYRLSDRNMEYYNFRWSVTHMQYILGSVYLEYRGDHVFSETVVYFQGEPIYVEDLQPWTDDLGRTYQVPKPGLSDELDQLVSEFKQDINS